MALILKIPKPIEVETESLGQLLLAHWSLDSMAKAEKFKSLKSGDVHEFMGEFINAFARKYNVDIEDKREAFEKGENIKNIRDLSDKDFENIAAIYVSNELSNLIPHYSENDDDYESLQKENNKLKVRFSGETNQEYLRRLVNASLNGIRIINKNFAKRIAGIAGKWREPLLANSKALNDLDMQINSIRSIPISPPPVIENPIRESNAHLNNITILLEKLTLLTDAGISQAKLLNEKSTSLLEAAAESGRQAKISVFIATFAIIISVGMSVWSILESKQSSQSASDVLENIRDIEQSYKAELSSDLKGVNKRINEYNSISEKQFNLDNQKIENESKSLNEIIKILTSIEENYSNNTKVNNSNKQVKDRRAQ